MTTNSDHILREVKNQDRENFVNELQPENLLFIDKLANKICAWKDYIVHGYARAAPNHPLSAHLVRFILWLVFSSSLINRLLSLRFNNHKTKPLFKVTTISFVLLARHGLLIWAISLLEIHVKRTISVDLFAPTNSQLVWVNVNLCWFYSCRYKSLLIVNSKIPP